MSECNSVKLTYYQKNKNVNRAKDYYENDKERLRCQGRDKYRNLTKKKRENMEKQMPKYG